MLQMTGAVRNYSAAHAGMSDNDCYERYDQPSSGNDAMDPVYSPDSGDRM